jgi:hypothetical protein
VLTFVVTSHAAGQTQVSDTERTEPDSTLVESGRRKQNGSSQDQQVLTLSIGGEFASASGFDKTKVGPGIGVAFSVPLGDPIVRLGRVPIYAELATLAQYTQAATVREHRSCQSQPIRVGDVDLVPDASGQLCTPDSLVSDTVFRTRFLVDSVPFRAVGVWRGLAQGRVEAELRSSPSLRLGLVGFVGIQSNPNDLTDPHQQQLRLLNAGGASLRAFSSDGIDRFALDIVYGDVQHYAQQDRLLPGASPSVTTEPLPIRREAQWQAALSLRPAANIRVRGLFTFNAPAPSRLGDPPIPDLARIAVLWDSDFVKVVCTLLARDDCEKKATGKAAAAAADTRESQPPVPSL